MFVILTVSLSSTTKSSYILSLTQNADVMKNACMALASLVSESEESAFAALSNGGEQSGIKVVIDAYGNHKDNPDVVENVCSFFMEMCEYGR